ncbi:MAG: HD domain-containing protein [Candidatus Omnitrophica bacterium]|nr:HD domain-containing protein [Candidatus Omnitrophota bacterium]
MSRFQVRVTLVLISAMCGVVLLSNIVICQFTLNAQFQQLREKLMVIARTSALTVDVDKLMAVPLNRKGMETPEYKAIEDTLVKIKRVNDPLAFIYIMMPTGHQGIWQFVVDADPVANTCKGVTAYPGDKYNAGRFPRMEEAFQSNIATADNKLERDEWGTLLSGYAPIRDKNGKAVAVLGVDMQANDVYRTQRVVYVRTIFVLFLGIGLSLVLGLLLSRQITDPVKQLVQGTRYISRGDLDYKVHLPGEDEISELAQAFNSMASDLRASRKKNHEYFYGVIQSMVRIVEAKDRYTWGHSERVAEYAARIASQMGLSKDEVDAVRQIAVLHDIGKLGINDAILNKPGPLTTEEWDIVRTHPVVGEEILKPVSLSPQMLEIVRSHHERFDGSGYPDKLSGQKIHLFAQILSVADAYDAMTSSRAYRQTMAREDAVAELKKNKGTQFNPVVVDAFIQVLREEGLREV